MASLDTPEALEVSLANVRRLSGSNLAHQSKPAQLLIAIESSLQSTLPSGSTSTAYPPTAYFVALLQCLEKAINDEVGNDDDIAETENMGQGALIPATLYLLAIIVPETPAQVALSKLSPLLESILPLFDTALEHPPALRSLLQITTALILFAPPNILNNSPLLKKSWNYCLELNLDPRPKVRHLAQEGVRKVLTTPVPPKVTAGNHPYLARAREWVTSHLEEETKAGGAGSKKKARFAGADDNDDEGKKVIWIVQGLRGWVAVWGDDQLSSLCSSLLSLPPLPHLTPQIYSLLAHLLSPPPADQPTAQPSVLTNLPTIIDSLLSSPPDVKSSDMTTYISALSSALIKMSLQDPLSLPAFLTKAFNLLFNTVLLGSTASPNVLNAAAEAVGSQGIVRYCISDEMILATLNYQRQGSLEPGARKKQKTPFLTRLLTAVAEALNTHALRMPYLLPILTALVSRLRIRVTTSGRAEIDPTGTSMTAAQELLGDLVTDLGDLRTQKGFEDKAKVDDLVGMAIEVMGVEAVLDALPLNIEPDASGNTPQPGRAHLLPLIRAHVTNDSLAFFSSYFRPLSERIFSRKVAAEDMGRSAEAKVWEVVVGQIWDCFPGFCELTRDLKEGLTPQFLSLLTNLLYTQPLLLSPLLRALSQLVQSTQRLATSATTPEELRKQFGIDQAQATANIAYLKTLAKDMVSVLLNVFSKLPRDQRGQVGEVISAWVGIMSEADLVAVYQTVTTHLSSSLASSEPAAPGASPTSHTMLDLLIIFVPYLPQAQLAALFKASATPTMLEHHDATVQKKSYRLLKRLLESGKLGAAGEGQQLEEFVGKVVEAGSGIGPGAQRDRLQLLTTIVQILPKDRLHLVPELLSEAVLGTKEVNERARDAGFELVVTMGHKMAKGGVVKQQVPTEGAGEDEEEQVMHDGEVDANVEEFITMVAAGLTGTTPHMISASINALTRLIFEFKDDISDATLNELISTNAVFLQSKNREIVKSALGLIKLLTITLPAGLIVPHLNVLVPALLGWVHDHKNHFKQKTVHIFERMIRKFGFDEVYKHAPVPEAGEDGGQRKVLDGIRKRKERAKRKKGKKDEADGDEPTVKASAGNAFEDVLYNSDSDEDDGSDSDDGQQGQQRGQQKGRPIKPLGKVKGKKDEPTQRGGRREKEGAQTYIRNEGDEPMDLLSRSIAGGVSSSNPNAKVKGRKPGQDAARFKTDSSGKLVIPAEDSDDERTKSRSRKSADEPAPGADGEGTAFLAAQRGVDGASRDARGNLRFNKNTKRTRAEDDEMLDLDEPAAGFSQSGGVVGGAGNVGQKQKKRKETKRLGEEFRAKRAGGDIKRQGGPDPYSYVPIGQAQKGKGGAGKVNLTNKKKGSRG